jgi:hypothetical protein
VPVDLEDPKAEQPPAVEKVLVDLELPPVSPTKAVAGDRVVQDFKAARAACADARKKARAEFRVQFMARKQELSKSNPDPTVLKDLNAQLGAFAFGAGKSQDTGPLPTHPALQTAVADYWKAMDEATRKLGEVAEKGLAAYEKAGVTDPAKLRPLLAARLASENAGLLGIWGSHEQGPKVDWIVDVDEATGGWRVDWVLGHSPASTGYLYHAEDIKFEAGKLSFIDSPVDTSKRKAGPGGTPASLALQDGKLIYQGFDVRKRPITRVLQRTGDESARANIDTWGVPRVVPADPGSPAEQKPDLTDANYVWRRLASLSSFPSYRGKAGPAWGEQLYIPFRSSHPTLTPGTYGGLADMLLGRSPGAGKNQQYAELLFREFDYLGDSPHPYLKRTAGEFLALSRARIQLAEADELMGNTPNSSIREFQQKVLMPAGRYLIQREVDRAELQEKLQKEHPDKEVIVLDAPQSAQSRQKLNELLDSFSGMMQDVKHRAIVSGLLAYADMAQVDRASALWQAWLLPLAKRCGGPPSTEPLVTIESDWKPLSAQAGKNFTRLKEFLLKNVSGQDLTHAVVEVIAENEWGEKAAHYYYFDRLDVSEVVRLLPHPRWEKRRLPFTNTIKVKWSVWADQGSEVDRQVKLTNPTPNPDPAGWRKDYLDADKKYQSQGVALGAVVRNFRFLPIQPERQRRRLQQIAAPGNSYAVRLTDKGKTLVVRFLRLDEENKTVEAEVIDLASRKPFRPDTPVWKGVLTADKEAGYVLRLDSGWTLLLAQDDQPTLSVPQTDESPARILAMVRVKLR